MLLYLYLELLWPASDFAMGIEIEADIDFLGFIIAPDETVGGQGVIAPDGKKISEFKFVQFREY